MKDKWSVLGVMGHRQHGVKAGCLAFLFLCGAISGWAADAETFKVTVIREPASIRDASGARLLDLNKDDVLVVIQPEEGNAYKVQTDETEPTVGYINRNLVRRVAEIAPRETPGSKDPSSPTSEKSWLARYWGWAAGGAALVAGGVALAAGSGGGSSGGDSVTAAGIWTGRAGTGQTYTVVNVNQSGGTLEGTCTWYGSVRRCWGSVSGTQVTLYIASESHPGQYDTWNLTLAGNNLSGPAVKRDGTPYQVNLQRQ